MAPSVVGSLSLEDVFKVQRERVQRGEYTPIGRLEVVVLGGDTDQPAPPWAQVTGRSLDWYKTGPMLGISHDQQDLLICSPVPHPPEIPDPRGQGPLASSDLPTWDGHACKTCGGPHNTGQCTPAFTPTIMARVKQSYSYVTRRKVRGSNWLELTPVELVHYWQSPIMGLIQGMAGNDGRHFTLFIDPNSGEGHFACGRFNFRKVMAPEGISSAMRG